MGIVRMVCRKAKAPGTVTADTMVLVPTVSANRQDWSTRHFSSGFKAHRPTWRQRQRRCRLFVSSWRRRRLCEIDTSGCFTIATSGQQGLLSKKLLDDRYTLYRTQGRAQVKRQ